MYLPHIVIMIVALSAIIMWLLKGYKDHVKDDRSKFPAFILASWIVASAVFGPYFLVFRPAGIFDITIERILFGLLIFFLLTGLFKGKVSFLKNITIEKMMGVFALICIISMIQVGFVAAAGQLVSPWFVFVTGYLFPFIVFIFAKNYIVQEKDMTLILHTLFYFGIYLSVTAFFEFYNLRQYVFPRYINDPIISPLHLERARGPFLNAGYNGFGILVGLISGIHLLQKKTGFAKVFHQAALLLFLPAVFFTQTRMVYIGLIITLFIFLRWYKTSFSKWRLISLPLSILLIIAIVNSPRLLSKERREGGVASTEEVNIRLALMQQSYFLFTEHPFKGVGLAQFIPATTRSYKGPVPASVEEFGTTFQHNHLLGIATELGLIGLLAYLSLIILVLSRLKQLKGKLSESGIMGDNLRIAIFAIWFVFLDIGMFLEPSNSVFINATPFLFAGVADGMYTRSLQLGLLSESTVRLKSRYV